MWARIWNLWDFPLNRETIQQNKYTTKCPIQCFLLTKGLSYLSKITQSWKTVLVNENWAGFFHKFIKEKLFYNSVNLLWTGDYWDICKIKFLAGFIENKTKQKSVFPLSFSLLYFNIFFSFWIICIWISNILTNQHI